MRSALFLSKYMSQCDAGCTLVCGCQHKCVPVHERSKIFCVLYKGLSDSVYLQINEALLCCVCVCVQVLNDLKLSNTSVETTLHLSFGGFFCTDTLTWRQSQSYLFEKMEILRTDSTHSVRALSKSRKAYIHVCAHLHTYSFLIKNTFCIYM